LSNDIEKKLLGALEALRETSKKNELKNEQKVWSDIQVPLTLHDGLSRYSKNDLDGIRKQLEIKNASSLKKADLIFLLETRIPESLKEIGLQLDDERFKLLKKIVQNEGYIPAPNLEKNQINFFQSTGFIYTGTYNGKRILTIPQEVAEKFKYMEDELESIICRNTEWIKLTQGLLYYYGTLSIKNLLHLLEKYTNHSLDVHSFFSVIHYAYLYNKGFYQDRHGFSFARVFDPEKVLKEQHMRKKLDYYPFTKEQLLRAGEAQYVDRNDSYKRFVNFLTENYKITRKDAEQIVEECEYAARQGEDPNSVLHYLQGSFEFTSLESVQVMMDHVVEMMNNTRQWFLKGYSPNELFEQEKNALRPLLKEKNNLINMQTKKKIGRNDPCTCGSGEKFKKCCGK